MASLELERHFDRFPKRLLLCSDVTTITPSYQLEWVPMDIGEAVIIPTTLNDTYKQRLANMETVLLTIREKMLTYDQTHPRDPNYESRKTRELVKLLFPNVINIIKGGGEKAFFHETTIEDYVEYVASPGGRGFINWTRAQLPPRYHQPTEFIEDVNVAESPLDLVRLFGDERVVVRQQMISLSASMYLFALVDLTRRPDEEMRLDQFIRQASKAFPVTENISLQIQFNKEGQCILSRVCCASDDSLISAHAQARADKKDGFKTRQLTARKIGLYPHEYVIFVHREKEPYSEMLKIMRRRKIPVADRQGARFILGEKVCLPKFVDLLQKRLPNWKIEEEKVKTPTPSSMLEYEKYFAWLTQNPEIKVEVQIGYLADNGNITRGSWLQDQYGKDTNFRAFRMRQLSEGPLQFLFPSPSCNIDWSNKEVQKELFEYANLMALL